MGFKVSNKIHVYLTVSEFFSEALFFFFVFVLGLYLVIFRIGSGSAFRNYSWLCSENYMVCRGLKAGQHRIQGKQLLFQISVVIWALYTCCQLHDSEDYKFLLIVDCLMVSICGLIRVNCGKACGIPGSAVDF